MTTTDKVNLVLDEDGASGASRPPMYEEVPQGMPMVQQPYNPGVQAAPYMQAQQAPQPTVVQPNISNTVVQVMTQPTLEMPKPPFPQKINAWTTGICDCCSDMGICCFGFFCGPCQACQVAIHMDENCCTPCCGGLAGMRTKLRTMLGIRGSVNSDCCATACCGPCAVCQMEREMNNWGI